MSHLKLCLPIEGENGDGENWNSRGGFRYRHRRRILLQEVERRKLAPEMSEADFDAEKIMIGARIAENFECG